MKVAQKNMISILISMIISIIFFLLVLLNENSTIVFSLEVLIIIFYCSCIVFIYKDRFNPFSFVLISFGLGILDVILVALKIRDVKVYYSMHIYEKALFIIILWMILFLISYVTEIKKQKKIKSKFIQTIKNTLDNADVKKILYIASVIYVYIVIKIILTIKELGGIQVAIVNSAVFRYNNQGYMIALVTLCAIIPICFLELKKDFWAYMSSFFMILILIFTGRRGLIINAIIIPFVVYYNYRRKKILNKNLIGIVILCIAIILIIGNFRKQDSINNTNSFILNFLTDLSITTQMGENLPDLIVAIDNKKIEYQYFKYLDRGIVGLIPRKIWSNKPILIDHSMIVSKLVYNIDTYGRPVGPFGFAYLCFGTLGVALSAIITAKIVKTLYIWMKENNNYISVFLYAIMINYAINIIKPEALMNIITYFIIIIISSIVSIKSKNK